MAVTKQPIQTDHSSGENELSKCESKEVGGGMIKLPDL